MRRSPQKYMRRITDLVNPVRISIHLKRRILKENLIVVLATAHRVGSTWLYEMIRDLASFERGSIFLPRQFNQTGTILLEAPGAISYLAGRRGYKIFKTHSYPVHENSIRHMKFLSVYRDPRDVITSSVFYVSSIPREIGGWGSAFEALADQEKIKRFICDGEFCLSRLEQWFRCTDACQTRYEDLQRQPAAELHRIVGFLGIVAGDEAIQRVVQKHTFEAKSRRKPGQEARSSAMRKGISGDWRNYFDPECVQMFKHEKEGRWNKLLVDMGYERTLDW